MTTTNKGLAEPPAKFLNWNTPLNSNFAAIDKALGGKVTIDVTGVTATPVALTLTQYQNLIIAFTGILTANVTYQVPSGVGGEWIISNSTSGAFSVTVTNAAGGASTVIAQGETHTVYSDGAGVYLAETALSVTSIPNAVTVQPTNAATNTVTNVLTLDSQSSGTPAAGIGAGLAFAAETASGTTKTGMLLQAVSTDVTTGSEDFDYVLKLMAGGAAATEVVRVTSTGAVSSASVTGNWVATQTEAEAGSNNDQIMTPLRTEQHMVANALGWGQTWQDVKSSRALSTTYTNSTGRPIFVSVTVVWGNASATLTLTVDGIVVQKFANNPDSSDLSMAVSAVVPNGSTYSVAQTSNVTAGVIEYWAELR